MHIKKLHVNNFGKLKNKDIELNKGINIIYGKNESGKSTLLDFIISAFYGIDKTKAGKEISNFDKYLPWDEGEFSGKICYELDNGEEFEVFRNFAKKSPQIFDKNANDITNSFSVDKSENMFFYEQTKVDEELFKMSMVIPQQEVKLDKKSQNVLIQKASNIMLTGEDDVSYKEILAKLNKRQSDEIGTLKSPTKPIYIVNKSIEDLKKRKDELEGILPKKYEINEEIESLEKQIKEEENTLKVLQEIEKIQAEENLKSERIKINLGAKEEVEKNKNELEKALEEIKEPKRKNKVSNGLYCIPLVALIISGVLFALKNLMFGAIGAIVSIILACIIFSLKSKENKRYKEELKEVKRKKKEILDKIELLNEEIKSREMQIKEEEGRRNQELKIQEERIKLSYGIEINIAEALDRETIIEEQNYINNLKLELSKKEYFKKNLVDELEELPEVEEKLSVNKEKLKELLEYNEAIEIAKDALDKAYSEMKESITPKFTKNLSKSIESITNGKYKNVKVNEDNGLSLESENGNYINANSLSVGTIDQLYLSLRISSIDELSSENMPIILDETFAYFDENRLENVLKFLSEEYENKQIIILTCTNREIEILDKIDRTAKKLYNICSL